MEVLEQTVLKCGRRSVQCLNWDMGTVIVYNCLPPVYQQFTARTSPPALRRAR